MNDDLPVLNLPETPLEVLRVEGVLKVQCLVRKKKIILTPEEWVRQHFIYFLYKELGYPLSLMKVEKQILVNNLKKRFDIVTYNASGEMKVLIECKSARIDLDASVADNIKSLAAAKKVNGNDITACVLERDRHADIIESLRSIGSKIILIPDGDVAGVMMTSQEEIDVDIYFGTGGAPEGVLAAAALQCIGGQIQSRLVIRNDEEKLRAEKLGIKDLNKKYMIDDLATGDIVFVATGVTEGTLVKGVKKIGEIYTTHSIVLRSDQMTTQYIQTNYPNII